MKTENNKTNKIIFRAFDAEMMIKFYSEVKTPTINLNYHTIQLLV